VVTSEYTLTFEESISEFEMLLICRLGTDFSYNEDFTFCTVESDLTTREFLTEIAQLTDVENIGLIKHIITLEPDWLNYHAQ